ncbi:MAG: hypothetical protein ACKV2Q_15480 [Planctomycetaceae bacterium]
MGNCLCGDAGSRTLFADNLEGDMMRLARWLDQLRKGSRKRRGTPFRCPRWSLVVECLETRTQLTGVMFLATVDPAVFELSVPQRGAVTLAIRNADDSRFVGEVAVLSPSGRNLEFDVEFVEDVCENHTALNCTDPSPSKEANRDNRHSPVTCRRT